MKTNGNDHYRTALYAVKYLFEASNPRLLRKPVKQGKEYSLYLEYQMGYNHETGTSIRKKETLSLYVMASPRTVGERQKVKETIELAKKIRFEREQEFLENKEGYRLKKDKTQNFLDFYQAYIENYDKKDLRMVRIAYNRFVDFLKVYHPLMAEYIKPDTITHDMMLKFADYLQTRSVGEGAKSILQRFKKVVRFCVSQGLMAKDPCEGVKCIVDDQVLKKDVLSQEEIQRLIDTHYPREKGNVRNAFIFKPEDSGKGKEDLIFDLPTYESCCKSVRRWVKRAGIDKHISWHCARHSFAVNILNNGANIKTVASLLGHSGLKHTEKYTRAVDKLKENAINSLPELKL